MAISLAILILILIRPFLDYHQTVQEILRKWIDSLQQSELWDAQAWSRTWRHLTWTNGHLQRKVLKSMSLWIPMATRDTRVSSAQSHTVPSTPDLVWFPVTRALQLIPPGVVPRPLLLLILQAGAINLATCWIRWDDNFENDFLFLNVVQDLNCYGESLSMVVRRCFRYNTIDKRRHDLTKNWRILYI